MVEEKVEEIKEEYELVEYTKTDYFWDEVYGTLEEFLTIIAEAAWFLLNENSHMNYSIHCLT